VPWRKVRFKDAEVLARCDAQGKLTADGGRVEIRYRASDSRAYHAALRNLVDLPDAEVLPDDACVPAGGAGDRPRTMRGGLPARSKSPPASKALEPDAIVIYADGACSGNPGPAGSGVVLIDGKARRELSQFLGVGTNNIAELTAIELAALAIEDRTRKVRIHTDSQYSIGVLTKDWKAKANVELVARVRKLLAEFSDVQLIYVPGHAGVVLNERADALAVQAVEQRASSGWVVVAAG
jgi:ribonuclease HI